SCVVDGCREPRMVSKSGKELTMCERHQREYWREKKAEIDEAGSETPEDLTRQPPLPPGEGGQGAKPPVIKPEVNVDFPTNVDPETWKNALRELAAEQEHLEHARGCDGECEYARVLRTLQDRDEKLAALIDMLLDGERLLDMFFEEGS